MIDRLRSAYRAFVPLEHRLTLRKARYKLLGKRDNSRPAEAEIPKIEPEAGEYYFEQAGLCPICHRETRFIARNPWHRDHLRCQHCGSLPRERALISVLEMLFPNWRNLKLHESSPGSPSSMMMARECAGYIATHYYPDIEPGKLHEGIRCENLEQQTFPDESFDIVITQDVFEHIFDYRRAFRDVMRTIKPGGAHIFTTPKYKGLAKTEDRAVLRDGQVVHLTKPEYHGNPIDPQGGALVTVYYGDDLPEIIYRETGCPTTIYILKQERLGTAAVEFIEVFVTRKV